jgi:hypothetical protein
MRYPALHTSTHSWLKQLIISHVPGPTTALAEQVTRELIGHFEKEGHKTPSWPSPETDVILTTARLGEPLGWRDSFMFTARRRFQLKNVPTVFTIVHATPGQFKEWMTRVEGVLKEDPEAAPPFEGVPASASRTLFAQGRRGGAILYLLRIIQIQTKCIRVLFVVGEEQPQYAFLFDLVGAHPQIWFGEPGAFYRDIATRVLTAASTREITDHETVEAPITREEWESLPTIDDMTRASHELGKRDFFTEMIKVSQLAEIPGFNEAISSQYSEGCFATWEPRINGLLTTITGSARPVHKENITDKDLAVIAGIKPNRDGALIRKVEGHPNHPPSSEAVEMIGMDLSLPKVTLQDGAEVPVIRSKLHGHRGVRAFDWTRVEYVPLPESYLHYPVSCSTDAQYRAVQAAFSNSYALQNPEDSRQLVFTVLPGHGMVLVEKWVQGKAPFQVMWEAMDSRIIEITNHIPQGPFAFETHGQHCRVAGDSAVTDFEMPHEH